MRDVSIDDKIHFLKWFLNNHSLKKIEAKWLLEYIAAYPKLMERLHFVSDAKAYEESVFISSKDMNTPSFIHRNKDLVSHDIEQYYLAHTKNSNKEIYVELNFLNRHSCNRYLTVLIEDPKTATLSYFEKMEVENMINHSLHTFKERQLLLNIDNALDEHDAQKFYRLSTELIKIYKNKFFEIMQK